jgi:hypothetical protein
LVLSNHPGYGIPFRTFELIDGMLSCFRGGLQTHPPYNDHHRPFAHRKNPAHRTLVIFYHMRMDPQMVVPARWRNKKAGL